MENRGTVLMQRYEVGRQLGKGTFAEVHYARNLKTGQSVAIKTLNKPRIVNTHIKEKLTREITAMRLVKHPNIVELFEVMADEKKIYLVLEYAEGGELFDKIAKGKLPEDVARRYFQQLIGAIDYCHSRGVYHRDLKLENVLLDENDNVKLSDFGLSAIVDANYKNVLLQTMCGTPAYSAPEVVKGNQYDGAKADVWSCGVILFFLLAGFYPFQDSNVMKMARKIKTSDYKCPEWFPPEVRRLIAKMLMANPSFRISIANIRKDRWFRLGLYNNSSGSNNSEGNHDSINIPHINAFDIISLSAGLDLSTLFNENDLKKELRFAAIRPLSAITSQLESMAESLELKIVKKETGMLRMERSKVGRKGVLAINAEIFEVIPSFHLVEIKKSNGDTLEYQKLVKKGIRPALQDIVWKWHNDQGY